MRTIKKNIRGIEYVAAWRGMAFSESSIEACRVDGTDRLSNSKLADIVFNEIIISPKVNIDDFKDFQVFDEVMDFGKSVLFGEFEKKKSKSQLEKEVRNSWGAYRLIFCDMANYTEEDVFNKMTPQEIQKANIALDMIEKEIKKKTKSRH